MRNSVPKDAITPTGSLKITQYVRIVVGSVVVLNGPSRTVLSSGDENRAYCWLPDAALNFQATDKKPESWDLICHPSAQR
ncbi:hypothetical protein GEV33_003316 [Tenebrio molitor]|uniref:Uncharacterized protein n=1 Tax=Tenebrio molitor TaxID=7067 RepID=A0A8J6HIP1_TENMO|nr:hypothetical protein GEV33_003316 [Tenebrio molitor]